MSDYVDSYYARTRGPYPVFSPLQNTIETETCVIGGGLAGVNTALGLAERGRQVVLLEAQRIGWGASGRNGGFVSPGFALGARSLFKRVGAERGRALFRLTQDAMALVEGRIAALAIDCAPVKGIVRAAWCDRPAEMQQAVDFYRQELGETAEFWPRERVREAYRTDQYYDAMFLPECFHLHPLNYVLGLAKGAAEAGAVLCEDTTVTGLDLTVSEKRIKTAGGTVKARHVVFCCSGYIDTLHPALSRATLPVGTYVVVTEPLGARLEEAIRVPYGLSDSRLAGDYYRPLGDKRILWGGRMRALSPPADLKSALLGDLLKIYPQLAGIRADVAWEGLMGYATHKMPQIGRLSEGVWYCMGFGGHGLGTTTVGGELIAAAVAEADDRIRLFEPFGLTYAGGVLGPYVAQLVYWGHQVRDMIRM